MIILPFLAGITASFGWAAGIVLAQKPATVLGAFEFTRIQLVACSAILALTCTIFGYWTSVSWLHWQSFVASICVGIVLGNLAMIECLRRGGPRRTELFLSLKAPLVAVMAYFWFGETLSLTDLIGASITLSGVIVAIIFGTSAKSPSDKKMGGLFMTVVLGVLAAAFQGFGFLIIKPALLSGTEPLAASAVRLLGAAILISVAAWLMPITRTTKRKLTPNLIGQTVLPGFIGYGISSSLLLYAFANLDAGIAAILGSLSPILVLPIIWLKDGVTPCLQAILGAVLAVCGAAIIILF